MLDLRDSYGLEGYPKPSEIIELFDEDDGDIIVKLGRALKTEKDNKESTFYKSYVLEQVVHDDTLDTVGHTMTYGILIKANGSTYAKVYSGARATACANLSVSAPNIVTVDYKAEDIKDALEIVRNRSNDLYSFIRAMKNKMYTDEDTLIGQIVSSMSTQGHKLIPRWYECKRNPPKDWVYNNWDRTLWKPYNELTHICKDTGTLKELDLVSEINGIFTDML